MLSDIVYWDHSYDHVLMVNLLVIIALFTLLRRFSGVISHINADRELLTKDNPAFGVSLAGVTFAVTILLSGTVYGPPENDALKSGIMVAVYGSLGIVLLAVSRLIFDKVALPAISLRDEIVKGNMAVAIADTANVLAVAIILRALMVWITERSFSTLFAFLMAYAISQGVLTLVTSLRRRLFRMRHLGHTIQKELADGNVALALSFAGRMIGTAFAISVASNLVVYEVYDLQTILLPWLIVSGMVILVLKILSFFAERIILFKVDIAHEVLKQRNIAVGALQGVIYLSMAILLAEL